MRNRIFRSYPYHAGVALATECIAQFSPSTISIPMRDGQQLAADLYLPEGFDPHEQFVDLNAIEYIEEDVWEIEIVKQDLGI